MIKNFKFINNLVGWVVFAIAAFTYISTIEPTASFWDCGEFITSAYKLEVGHPPGAPFFMILGNFFSMLAFGNVSHVAMMVNIMSALASAFTIIFLFWTITHLAKRLLTKEGEEISMGQLFTIMGSGIVGALTYTFSDTFWFSAVEGEVYAMSSLFTALVFWAILKWENDADEKYANRWLILIAYLMGLSIGVHLLNLLAIPAIVFVYYFRKYDTSLKGILATAAIAIAILGTIMYIIIPGVVSMAFKFDLLFTNTFGMPFNTGSFIFLALLIGGLIFGIYYSHKKGKVILNTIMLGVTVIMIGYSSFALIIIRSTADTPMDQNSPDNPFALLGYLNREQYGDRPLLYGQQFNAPVTGYEEGNPTYAQINGKYVVIDKKVIRKFDSEYMTIFPRMYSEETSPNHVLGYKIWTGLQDKDLFLPMMDEKNEVVKDQAGNVVYDKNKPKAPPSLADNIKYFFSYQINYMYFRYFMWNFAGRQSDIQGDDGNVMNGNWISGIQFIDEIRLGNQSKITSEMKNNPGRNTYYFLPLILGILGMVAMYRKGTMGKKYFWVVLMFFFFTGLAIVLYLNQPPFQPRERDYAYAGSFYVFTIFIGFGIVLLVDLLKKYLPQLISAGIITAACTILVPGILAIENWDDHDRSNRYTARDFAYNYLSSCPPNAILFTNGDNDTFPLWYAQEVEGYRTDVRVINLSYLNTDWYIEQMKRKAYESDIVPFSLTYNQIMEGKRNVTYVYENPYIFLAERYQIFASELQPQYKLIFDRFFKLIEKSKLRELQPKDFELLTKGSSAISPLQFGGLINHLAQKESIDKFGLQPDSIQNIKKLTDAFLTTVAGKPVPVDMLIKFIGSDESSAKVDIGGEMQNYFPTSKLCLPVDKNKVIENNIVAKKYENQIVPMITWGLSSKYVFKNDLMVLDLLANNNWKRPVCFATTIGGEGYSGLQSYFRLNGMVYQLVPLFNKSNEYSQGAIVDADSLYHVLMNKFKWGNVEKPNVYLDENNQRLLMNMKNNFVRLSDQLIKDGKKDSALAVLNRCDSVMPNSKIPYNYYNLLIAEQYYKLKKDDKGDNIIKILAGKTLEELDYYFSLDANSLASVQDNSERTFAMVQELITSTRQYKRNDLDTKFSNQFIQIMETNLPFLANVKNMNKQNEAQFYQWYASISDNEKQLISLYAFLVKLQQ